ncbi:MAG: winged helix-turn-helix domain-containing protein [Acetobacteraceae bacterium]
MSELILNGPDVEASGLSAWTLPELCGEIATRWGKRFHPASLSRVVRRLGFSRQKTRQVHPESDKAAQAAFVQGSAVARGRSPSAAVHSGRHHGPVASVSSSRDKGTHLASLRRDRIARLPELDTPDLDLRGGNQSRHPERHRPAGDGGLVDRVAQDRGAHASQARLYRKLGGTYDHFEQPPPPRPKGMHRKTYERLEAELYAAMEAHEEAFIAGASAILGRLEKADAKRR